MRRSTVYMPLETLRSPVVDGRAADADDEVADAIFGMTAEEAERLWFAVIRLKPHLQDGNTGGPQRHSPQFQRSYRAVTAYMRHPGSRTCAARPNKRG
jgi:hypothetical protein